MALGVCGICRAAAGRERVGWGVGREVRGAGRRRSQSDARVHAGAIRIWGRRAEGGRRGVKRAGWALRPFFGAGRAAAKLRSLGRVPVRRADSHRPLGGARLLRK
jgi:hypothetical protein